MQPLMACVVDKWAGGNLSLRPNGPFAVSWPRQLGELRFNCNSFALSKNIPNFTIETAGSFACNSGRRTVEAKFGN